MDKSRYKEQTEILRYFMKPYIHRNLFTALRIDYIIINLQLNNKRFDCQKVVKKIDGDFDSILRIITISKLQRTKKKQWDQITQKSIGYKSKTAATAT